MAVARFPGIVPDCPGAVALAAFYRALLDWKAEVCPDWAGIRAGHGVFRRISA